MLIQPKFVGRQVLPEDLGGSAPLVRIQDFDGRQNGSKTAEAGSDAKPESAATTNGAKSAIEEVKENGASYYIYTYMCVYFFNKARPQCKRKILKHNQLKSCPL